MAIAERVSDVATPEQTRLDGFSGHDLGAVARDLVAVLFAAAAPLEAADVARLLGVPGDVLDDVLRRLSEEPPLGLMIQRYEDRLQLTTAPAAGPAIERFLGSPPPVRLSRAALEALAVVAYRQPVTRGDIDAVRGVNSDSAVATLLSRNLVVEVGRKDTIGRPALLAVTPECLQYLGVASLSDLPPLPDGTPPPADTAAPDTSPDAVSPASASHDPAAQDSVSADTASSADASDAQISAAPADRPEPAAPAAETEATVEAAAQASDLSVAGAEISAADPASAEPREASEPSADGASAAAETDAQAETHMPPAADGRSSSAVATDAPAPNA